jgi:2-polyprenyl-6-methoxyphenol hydroxylase-like FAD-dependent oxidoreductase
VARAVQAPTTDARPGRTCAYYSYWDGISPEGAELYPREGNMLITGPTNDGQALVLVSWPRAEFRRIRRDVEHSFLTALERVPSVAERVRAGQRTDRFYGTGDLPFFIRKPYGPGWALVGDAGYHKDPITAEGITDAFRDAELLADAMDDGLSGRRPLEDALADYERVRDEDVRPVYELTYELAGLQAPAPEMQALLGALRDNPEETSRFFGTIARTVSMADFQSPENIARILGAEAAAA